MENQLPQFFEELNRLHFQGQLALPILKWNARLRTSAGRFIPGGRHFFTAKPPVIEIARYLLEEPNAQELVRDTLGHEMIHYWLWMRRRPYGHTPEFSQKMKAMGVSRYNSVPRRRPPKYLYHCTQCLKVFPSRKRKGSIACLDCCRKYARGKYDVRFKLVLEEVAQTEKTTEKL